MSFAVVCSGQGAQGSELFRSVVFTEKGKAVRDRVLALGELEKEVMDWLEEPEGKPELILENRFAQPLIALYQMMVWAELSLPDPKFFAGYSLGELSAYGCAGAMRPEEVVRLAGKRAEAMDGGRAGGLVVEVGIGGDRVEEVARGVVGEAYLAIVMDERHCVVGCAKEKKGELVKGFLEAGAERAQELPVSVAAHTPFLDSAVALLGAELRKVEWKQPRVPILAGIDAGKVFLQNEMETVLSEQVHGKIRWDLVVARMRESGCQVVLELGPGRQLAHELVSAGEGMDARSVEEFHSWEGVQRWVEAALNRQG